MIRDLLTVVLGVLTGALSGAFGIGGAVLSTPGVRVLGASALVAVGSTLPSILPGAVAGTIRYARGGLVDWRVVAATAPAGVAGAVAGAVASDAVPGDGRWLMVITAALLGVTAVRLGRGGQPEPPSGRRPRPPPTISAGIGLAAGFLSGLLGLGGGLVLVPAFLELLRLPTKVTIATSLACVGVLAIPGTVTHAALGHVDWRIAGLLAVGVVPGARLGSRLAIRAEGRRLRLAVAAVLGVLAAVYGVTELRAVLSG
ncbi:MAG: sulfite exporter TauE/SafE family protein [Acidimicrobiales bacterium]